MKIKRVHIENYRSIKVLDFEPGPYCVLIGENNAGKSNILRALNLVLGEGWPSERYFSEDDFFNRETDNDIVIQIFFDEVHEDWHNNHPASVGGFELRCKAYKRKVGDKPAGSLKVEYVCIDAKGDRATHPDQPLQKGQQFKGHWIPKRVSSELREKVPFIYVDVLREYDRQTPSSRWSVLRRLFNEVNTAFLHDKMVVTVLQPDGSNTKMTRKDAFESTVRAAYQYLRTDLFMDIEKRLKVNALQQMGIDVRLKREGHVSSSSMRKVGVAMTRLSGGSTRASSGTSLSPSGLPHCADR